jgi:hypothetical protein
MVGMTFSRASLIGALLFLSLPLCAQTQPAILPVDQIRPGMLGVTYTVLQGNEVVPLKTEILGVARNSQGPGLDLIICRLEDSRTDVTGAVHGMSGSPLYVDGKLVGALSERIASFEKDGQCGFTPIQDMMKVEALAHPSPQQAQMSPESVPFMNFTAVLPHNTDSAPESNQSALAVPLSVCGVQSDLFGRWLNRCGLGNMFVTVPGGGSIQESDVAGIKAAADIKPGSPLAAVFMTGDISVTGTGTCTWRDGDRVLAFGHPMFGFGTSQLPMAGAQVVTTVPSFESPYKLTNTGPVIGTIQQDRISAIAGEIGTMPPMATYEIERTHEGEKLPELKGSFAPHPLLTPMLIGTAMESALGHSLEKSRALSVHMTGTVTFEGHAPLKLDGIFSGEDTALPDLLSTTLDPLEKLFGQTDEHLVAKNLHVSFNTQERMKTWTVESVRTDSREVEPNGKIRVTVEMREDYGARTAQTFEVALPENVKSGNISIRVGGAADLNDKSVGREIDNAQTVDQMITAFNSRRLQDRIYVQAVSAASGEVVENHEMPALPDSVRSVMEGDNSSVASVPLPEQVWLEMSAQLPGVVKGHQEVQVAVR